MKREQLIELIHGAVSAQGYVFLTGETHLAGSTVRVYPAAWLEPPVLLSRTGRCEGETTWRLRLYLMTLPAGSSSTETMWQMLEGDALRVTRLIADSETFCSIGNIGCTPARKSLTVHGEISVVLSCDVTMWYYS